MSIKREIKNGSLVIVETKKLTPMWGKNDFSMYNDDFVRARSRMRDKMNRCYCCDRPFQINQEMVHLVHFNNGVGNKLVCSDCFSKLEFKDKVIC